MANAEARLRLIIEAVDRSSSVFKSILAQAQTAGSQIQQALNKGMAGGGGGGAQSNDPFAGIRATVTKSRKDLENFYTFYADQVGKIGSVPLAKNLSDHDLSGFHGKVMGLNTQLEKTPGHLETINRLLAWQNISIASAQIERFGKAITEFLAVGIGKSMEFEETGVDLANALKINLDPALSDFDANTGRLIPSLTNLTTIMDKLKQKAFEVGVQTKFTDELILAAMSQMAASGIDSSTILNGGAQAAANLAQATKTDLLPTTKIMTAIWHSMGKTLRSEFGDNTTASLSKVSDVLTNIRLTTGEDLTAIANTMKYVGPVADEFRMGFDEIGTAVAMLGRAGVQGSMAGTALRRMLTNLTPQSEAAAEAMQKLGLITADGTNRFFDAEGRMKSLSEVQSILHESMQGLTDEQTIYATKTIFGQYALQSMLKIVGTAPAEFNELANKIGQTGTAVRVAGEWAATTAGQWDILNERFDQSRKELGEALIPQVLQFIGVGNDLAEWFLKLDEPTKRLIGQILGAVGAFAAIFGSIMVVVSAFALFKVGMTAAGIAMAPLLINIALIAGVIVVLIAVGYLLIKNWDVIKAKTIEIWTSVKTWVVDTLASIGSAFSRAWDTIKTKTVETWTNVKNWVIDKLTAIGTFIMNLPEQMLNAVSSFGTWLKTTVTAKWTAFTDWLTSTWESMKTWFSELPGNIAYWIGFIAGKIAVFVSESWTAFTVWLVETWNGIKKWFQDLPGKTLSLIQNVGSWLGENIPKAWTAIVDWLTAMVNAYVNFYIELPGKIIDGVINVGKWLGENISKAWTAIVEWLDTMLTSIKTFFVDLPQNIANLVLDVAKWFGENIPKYWTAFTDWLNSTATSIKNWFTDLPSKLLDWINQIIGKLRELGGKIGQSIWEGIVGILDSIGSYVSGLIQGAISSARSAVSSIANTVNTLVDKAKEGFEASTNGSVKVDVPINEHAAGGIFARPTMIGNHLFGEAGPEALIPLSPTALERYGLGGNRNTTINININMNGSGSRSDAQDIASEVRRSMATVTSRF